MTLRTALFRRVRTLRTGTDALTRRRGATALATSALLGAALLVPAAPAAAVVPTVPGFGAEIDAYGAYVAESTCSPTEKPGAQKTRDLILRTYGPAWTNIVRACTSRNSGHEEGRSVDWSRNVTVPAERAQVDAFLGWLLATDAHGNEHAMARRMGISYLMWNGQIWGSYAAAKGWQPQTSGSCHLATSNATTCHRDHLHISLTWDGAYARTSLWAGAVPACVSGEGCPVSRLAGTDRYGTSVAIARAASPSSTTVVVANGESDHLVDGLVAGPLARKLSAPILLVPSTGVPPVVATEIARRGATTAVLVGGQAPLGDAVVAGLKAAGISRVDRVAGPTRYDTAAAVAARVGGTSAVVASGADGSLADALAVGGPAAATGTPVLLTPRTSLAPATARALAGRSSTVVVGGSGAVSDAVLAALPAPVRLGGVDRYATAVAVARHFTSTVDPASTVLAAGTTANLVDALPGAALGRVTVLTSPSVLPAATGEFIDGTPAVDGVVALGGTGAVSDAVLRTVSSSLGG